jgi:hypothetical protein
MADRKPCAFFCYGATRLVLLALSTGCLTLILSNSLALNFTVICMESTGTNNNNNNNGTENDKVTAVPMFSLQEQSWLFSAIAVGQLLGTLPITAFTTHFGIRLVPVSLASIVANFLIFSSAKCSPATA